jgi:integrase
LNVELTVDAAIRDFLESLAARSPKTEATYTTGLTKLREYLAAGRRRGTLNPSSAYTADLPPDLLEGFYLWLARGGDTVRKSTASQARRQRSAATIATYVAAASAWVRYLDRRRLLPDGVSYERLRGDLAAVKGRQSYKSPRVDDRIVLLLESVDRTVAAEVPGWFYGKEAPTEEAKPPSQTMRSHWLELLRDRALIHTIFSGALRREEAASLNRSDVKDGRAKRAVITGKGNKERVAFFGDDALHAIGDYLYARGDTYVPLFLRHDRARGDAGPNGERWRVSPHGVWDAVKKWSRQSGVRATTHHLRHAKASIMLNEGAKLEEVQDLLGHASPQTTKLIYAHYTVEHLEDAFDRFSPSAEDLIKRLQNGPDRSG